MLATAGADDDARPAPAETLPLLALAEARAQAPAAPVPPAAPAPTTVGRLRIYEPPASDPAPPAEAGLGIGLRGLVRAEELLAARLRALADRPVRLSRGAVEAWLAADGDARGLSDEQRAAVVEAATRGCFVLTGGPGVGKTTTVRALVRCLQALGRSVALAAPTGKAAKRLGDVVGLEARTIHRLLGAGPQGFRHGARDPLPFEVVIVDEASMLDTQLARAVVSAVGPRSQLILVGDADQLPSVGPGQVLRDLLASGLVPATALTTVFRQAARSQIVQNAHRIRRGELPELLPASSLGSEADCVFVPARADRVAAVAAEWAAERLPRQLGLAPGEVQALAPLTRVCQVLNSALQERLNPPRGQAERPHGALPLRLGDRVIQTRNNYTLGVFNGDSGRIASTVAHLAQHCCEQFPELGIEIRGAQVQPNDPAHDMSPLTFGVSEGGEVAVELPWRHRAVIGEELVTLDVGEVAGDAVARGIEHTRHQRVSLELVDCVQKCRRQGRTALPADVSGVGAAFHPVDAGAQCGGDRQVGIGGAVAAA